MADIERLDNIVEAIKFLQPNHFLSKCLEKDGYAVKHPGPNNFPCFYRGENSCFPSCKASLYRIRTREDRIIALLKTYDFIVFLSSLPEVKKFINIGGCYIPWALAQHYEFATPMIDLTNELAVAAFFATHYYDKVCKQYMLIKHGIGRIRCIKTMNPEITNSLMPIGVQPFARPDRQDGYGFWIPEDQDFADYSFSVDFIQDADVNLRLKTAMIGGTDYYFPNEQLVLMASEIKNTNAVTSMVINAMLCDIAQGFSFINPIVTIEEINQIVTERNIFVVDAPLVCP